MLLLDMQLLFVKFVQVKLWDICGRHSISGDELHPILVSWKECVANISQSYNASTSLIELVGSHFAKSMGYDNEHIETF